MRYYQHIQVGWLTIGLVIAVLITVRGLFAGSGLSASKILILAFAALILLLFASLTVTVTDTAVLLRFGIGLMYTLRPFPYTGWRETSRSIVQHKYPIIILAPGRRREFLYPRVSKCPDFLRFTLTWIEPPGPDFVTGNLVHPNGHRSSRWKVKHRVTTVV